MADAKAKHLPLPANFVMISKGLAKGEKYQVLNVDAKDYHKTFIVCRSKLLEVVRMASEGHCFLTGGTFVQDGAFYAANHFRVDYLFISCFPTETTEIGPDGPPQLAVPQISHLVRKAGCVDRFCKVLSEKTIRTDVSAMHTWLKGRISKVEKMLRCKGKSAGESSRLAYLAVTSCVSGPWAKLLYQTAPFESPPVGDTQWWKSGPECESTGPVSKKSLTITQFFQGKKNTKK